jgi:hypothetical protein
MKSRQDESEAIAETPNTVSAPSPKFQRGRRVDSIEAVRGLIERGPSTGGGASRKALSGEGEHRATERSLQVRKTHQRAPEA